MKSIRTDGELIEKFLTGQGQPAEAAFQALVNRHGPMVLGVCRHILDRQQDAEDAFQATFLALARKAGTIRNRQLLGCWLYEVAYRTSLRLRGRVIHHRQWHRAQREEPWTAPAVSLATWDEARPMIHAELNRLPAKYGIPLALCYLEGETNVEVARLLHWPVGTVKVRLSRGRGLLRERLRRRGLTGSPIESQSGSM